MEPAHITAGGGPERDGAGRMGEGASDEEGGRSRLPKGKRKRTKSESLLRKDEIPKESAQGERSRP